MKLSHIAIWSNDLEKSKTFYKKYFNGISNKKYINTSKGFESYFITFENNIKLEIMKREDIYKKNTEEILGFSHIAFSCGNRKKVDDLTKIIESDGYKVISKPRITGDGYYESVILDPDNNRIEIVE